MILTKDLSVKYDNRIIHFPDLDVKSGEHLLILGKSGSGKTSFLNVIGGLSRPYRGHVSINSKTIASLSKNQLDVFRGLNIGFVFQTPHFVKSLSIENNLLLNQFLVGNTNKNHLNRLLEKVGLLNRKDDLINNLSEGEKQRISIVRSLINQPNIILADEPTSALDDENCEIAIDLLKELSMENNACLIIVTHDSRLKSKFNQYVELDVT